MNFYSPMCSHCHHLAPTWRTVAKELEGVIRVGAVNCEDDWQLCHQIGIRSYPTLLHYPRVRVILNITDMDHLMFFDFCVLTVFQTWQSL